MRYIGVYDVRRLSVTDGTTKKYYKLIGFILTVSTWTSRNLVQMVHLKLEKEISILSEDTRDKSYFVGAWKTMGKRLEDVV